MAPLIAAPVDADVSPILPKLLTFVFSTHSLKRRSLFFTVTRAEKLNRVDLYVKGVVYFQKQ